jgi:hypothetical protein
MANVCVCVESSVFVKGAGLGFPRQIRPFSGQGFSLSSDKSYKFLQKIRHHRVRVYARLEYRRNQFPALLFHLFSNLN